MKLSDFFAHIADEVLWDGSEWLPGQHECLCNAVDEAAHDGALRAAAMRAMREAGMPLMSWDVMFPRCEVEDLGVSRELVCPTNQGRRFMFLQFLILWLREEER